MRLSYFIAKRYLFAKKSHNVINIISIISAVGIAIGSAALIIVLSVYNGFEDIVRGMYDRTIPDITVSCDTSKYFRTDTPAFDRIRSLPQVAACMESLEETVFVTYDGQEGTMTLKAVDSTFADNPDIQAAVWEGELELYHGQVAQAFIGRNKAAELGIRPRFIKPITVYLPARDRQISMMNPLSSLNSESFFAAATISSGNAAYNEMLFVPVAEARAIAGVSDNEAGIVEIRFHSESDAHAAAKEIRSLLGEGFSVKDKYMQNETIYRMMKIEKVVIFTILFFIIIVISCNVYGSLTMLIIEKRDDIATLKHLGAKDSLIRRIFFEEGWLIIMLGAVAGIAVGLGLCFAQQYFGIISMPGHFVVQAYPVVIRPGDIFITFAGIALIGLFITAIPTRKTLEKIL